jgi:hypothetical protein
MRWNGNTSNNSAVVGPYIALGYYGLNYEVGQVYTLSVWLKADYETSINLTGLSETHYHTGGSLDTTVTTTWKRFYATFIAQQASSNICFYTAKGATTSTPYVYMCGLKIEKGTEATDWCPADEDAM